MFDPFLLLDDFRSDNPDDYIAGFPWHPHRGIETVTYMVNGQVRHGDSMGNSGVIGPGAIQWMTAGSGIIHEEMPAQEGGLLWGFQLWVNLPRNQKMIAPRYRDFTPDSIRAVDTVEGIHINVVAGRVGDVEGAVRDIVAAPTYLDIAFPSGGRMVQPVVSGHTVFAYIAEGTVAFEPDDSKQIGAGNVVLLSAGDAVAVQAGSSGARLLLISGKPLHEPIAWYGPIVMNTEAELQSAFEQYRNGTFIKQGKG